MNNDQSLEALAQEAQKLVPEAHYEMSGKLTDEHYKSLQALIDYHKHRVLDAMLSGEPAKAEIHQELLVGAESVYLQCKNWE